MKAKQIIFKKHGTKGLKPMWLTLDIKQIVWLMKEYHKQQLNILNIQNVVGSALKDDERETQKKVKRNIRGGNYSGKDW